MQRQFFGAGVVRQRARGEGFCDRAILVRAAQIIAEGFAFVREAKLKEFQKRWLVADAERGAFAGQMHFDQCGSDFRRRIECAERDAEDEFGARIKLAER